MGVHIQSYIRKVVNAGVSVRYDYEGSDMTHEAYEKLLEDTIKHHATELTELLREEMGRVIG